MEKISDQSQNKPSLIKRILPVIIVVAIIFVLLKVMGGMKTEPAKAPEQPQGFLVETATLTTTDLTLNIDSQGNLQPKRQIALLAEISGKVVGMNAAFTAGGTFKQGDVLVSIDPADYQVAVSRAEANLASANAQLDMEQAKSEQAQKDWQSFGKKGKPSDLLLNKPQLAGAKAGVKAAQADLRKAQRDLSKTEIKAPFDGTVLSKAVDLGQFVGMSSQLGTLAGTAVGEVRLSLSNADIKILNLKNRSLEAQPLLVEFVDDDGQVVATGNIKRLESSKDSRTLMNYAVAEIDQPFEQNLLFNTYLQANITGSKFTDVYAIPNAWMMPNDQVAVYANDNTLAIKTVQVVHKTNDHFYVEAGVSSQDQIITTPIQAPEVGMQLRRVNDDSEKPDQPKKTVQVIEAESSESLP